MGSNGKKKRYAVVGTGGRSRMFIDAISKDFSDHCEIVGLCDPNSVRMQFYNDLLTKDRGYEPVATFGVDDFDQMVKTTRPDVVIVTTVDAFHDYYIIRAMDLGCDAITEKPMTIDDKKCRAVYEAIERTGKNLRVTFNYRWGPGPTMVKKLIMEETIGEVIHVDCNYLLNTSHGADYFRRWHREKDKSGGLLVHKSTHHFDLVNWMIDSVPQTIFAWGRLAFYGRANAQSRGVEVKYDRYTGNDTKGDPFAFHLDSGSEALKTLYMDAEKVDGYVRDRNVFGDNITIEDTMSVMVKYRTGIVMNYSLNAYLPIEGIRLAINGTKGRIEYAENHGSHIIAGQSDDEMAKEMDWHHKLTVYPMFGEAYGVEIPEAKGGHGGADPQLLEQIFSTDPPHDPYGRSARHGQGAASILIGIAANQSIADGGRPIEISDLCPAMGDAAKLSDLP